MNSSMDGHYLFQVLGLGVVAGPTVLVAVLGGTSLVGRPLSERTINRWTYASTVTSLITALMILAMMLGGGARHVPIDLGNLVVIPQQHFHFHLKFVFDRLSVPFVVLSLVLCGTVAAFASRYLHRERGYGRFFVCNSLFVLGMVVTSLAGTIEVLFFGWELVGLSSALLVAFFHERVAPVSNGIRVWSVYRIADAAFLIAAVAMHQLTGAGDFDSMMGAGPWPTGGTTLSSGQAFFVGSLLLVAAAGKSALVPFSGWLPRAMEGPTPSSAIFYGALSVHLGAFLLLRVSPILEASGWLSAAVVAIGLITALYGAVTARVQTDIKSALAFASLIQVGIIVAEIGLGLRYIALIHIIGHACLRTLQLLRAPTLLHDYHAMENAIGGHLPHEPSFWERVIPAGAREWCYRFALNRGYLDSLLNELIVFPFQRTFQWCDGMERRWTDFLSGGDSRESDDVEVHPETVEELRL
jgi:NADH:ubiquinone oxidoreductase subunit 5 (subunit L)/multisubunit Na+/H+ antiporter MnhA subunit